MPDENIPTAAELGVDWYFNQYRDRKYLSSRMSSLLAYTANMLNNASAEKRAIFLEVLYRLRPLAIFDFAEHPHPAVSATMKPLLRSPKTWTTADLTLFKGAFFALTHNAVLPPERNFQVDIKPLTSGHTRLKQAPVEARPEDDSPQESPQPPQPKAIPVPRARPGAPRKPAPKTARAPRRSPRQDPESE